MNYKLKMLNELNLSKNICFNQISQTDKQIHITKSKSQVDTFIEIREICNIQNILDKYQHIFDIRISIDEIIIQLK